MNRLLAIAVLALVFTATTAHAKGLYFSGHLGTSFSSEMEASGSGLPTTTINFDPGFAIGGAIGFGTGNFRLEGEIAYQSGDIEDFSISGFSFSGTGDGYTLRFMGNACYDFGAEGSTWVPYIGAGIGVAAIHIDGSSSFVTISGTESSVAVQLMAGVAYEMSPKTAFTLG